MKKSIIQNYPFLQLLPFILFVLSFLTFGILASDFYAIPSPIAVIIGITSAVILYPGSINDKMDTFIKGCGDSKIITMCVIYLLAGGFATLTQTIGGVDAIVSLGLQYLDLRLLPLAVFVIASFLSTASGTSVGCIISLGPIVMGFGTVSPDLLPLLAGSLLGGAMFGDNLSMISDTTIAATQSLGCALKDKFNVNLKIALPAAIVTIFILLFLGLNLDVNSIEILDKSVNYWSILPYFFVIIMALRGVHVFVTLLFGIVLAGCIGMITSEMSWATFFQETYKGFTSMTEIFILSMLTGGLALMVQQQGGIDYLVSKIKKMIRHPKSAMTGIGLITSLVNAAIANNTISIVVSGPIAKELTDTYSLDAKKSATIMDIFSCITQGILPYGAQVLFILSFAKAGLNYWHLLANSYYLYILLIVTLLSIYFPFIKSK